jgi:hypothetical protein
VYNNKGLNMSDCEVRREYYWWEHYPLHKLWCNDLFPLVPRFTYRKGDEWNANKWSVHWLIFTVWTMEHASFGIDAGLSFNEIYVGAILPYLRITVGIRHAYSSWAYKIDRLIRRKPAAKNENGEYNL